MRRCIEHPPFYFLVPTHSSGANARGRRRLRSRCSQNTTFLLSLAMLITALEPSAHAASCSLANAAGEWGFSYSGKALTTSGPAPLASSGYYSEDASGNMSGTETACRAPAKQARSVRQHFLTESHKPECSHLRR